MKIAFILLDGFIDLDLTGILNPFQILKEMSSQPVEWDFCGQKPVLTSRAGVDYSVTAHTTSFEPYDLVIIPGVAEVEKYLDDRKLLDWLETASKLPWLAAIGKGCQILAAANLLKSKQCAAVVENEETLRSLGAEPVLQGIVESDAIFTAASSSDALSLGVLLTAQIGGLAAAEKAREVLGIRSDAGTVPGQSRSPQQASAGDGLRFATLRRKTGETSIEVELDLDGEARAEVQTGLPFFDHMLTQIAVHGLFDLKVIAEGDLEIDPHHTVEDIALVLGDAFKTALGDRKGIQRMASFFCPMDESLARVVIDFSGRPYSVITLNNLGVAGSIPGSLWVHFFESFAVRAGCSLHINVLTGRDDHHIIEAVFKAFARCLQQAVSIDDKRGGMVPSSKGVLDS